MKDTTESSLTETPHMRETFREMAKSRNLMKLGWFTPLMGRVDQPKNFWSGPAHMGRADPAHLRFY